MIKDHHLVDVFIGVDVRKTSHHAFALGRTGKKLLDKALPQDEAKLHTLRSIQVADGQSAELSMLLRQATAASIRPAQIKSKRPDERIFQDSVSETIGQARVPRPAAIFNLTPIGASS